MQPKTLWPKFLLRIAPEMLAAIDKYRSEHPVQPSRTAVIREAIVAFLRRKR